MLKPKTYTLRPYLIAMHRSRAWGGGGAGGPGPPFSRKITKNIGFLSNTGPDPLKNHKADKLSQNAILGLHLHASEMPLKWRFAGG